MRLRGDTPFRLVMSAGAPATEAAADAIAQGFRAPRVDFYGASESFSMAYDGRIATTLRIAGLDGDGMAEAAPGEPGEVQTTGDMVFAGYLDDPAQTAAAVTADGWYRTGDVARIGPDGRLDLLGRLSEIINRGGVKIAPAEIEAPVLELPGVAEAAAFAIPDPALGEQPALAVVPHPGAELTARDIRRFLLGRLPPAKMPTRVFLLDALPVTAAGKVSRRDLAALLAPPDDPAGTP
ncbi:MAG: class I adenylate-forming enzyme family protein [Chloroflexota bacterium]